MNDQYDGMMAIMGISSAIIFIILLVCVSKVMDDRNEWKERYLKLIEERVK